MPESGPGRLVQSAKTDGDSVLVRRQGQCVERVCSEKIVADGA
jgi:hypothetical protein